MKKKWFILQFIWTLVKLTTILVIIGTVAFFPLAAAIASLVIAYLVATGVVSVKIGVAALGVVVALQGLWLYRGV